MTLFHLQKRLVGPLSLALLLGMFLVSSEDAKSKKKATPPLDTRILISSIDPSQHKVVFKFQRDKSSHTYMVDSNTQITIGHQVGQFSDIKMGMQVTGYVERDEDSLDSISVETAAPAPKSGK